MNFLKALFNQKKNYFMPNMYVLTQTLSFEIAEKDLPNKMEWREALEYTTSFGEKWRLPTKEELDEIYRLHQKGIGGFKFDYYWSSEGFSSYNANSKSFTTGTYSIGVGAKQPPSKHLVRLIRNI